MSDYEKNDMPAEDDISVENSVVDAEDANANANANVDGERQSKYHISQIMLIIRLIICGYILYIVKELVEGYMSGDGLPLPALIIVSLIFGLCGILVGIKSIIALVKGEFIGGKADM